jgi:uncharacterized protein YndB with AHSA1/START domain
MGKAKRLIRTRPETAFTYLSDLTRHGEWALNPGLTVEQTSPGAVAPGATFHSRGSQFGLTLEDEVKVTRFEPPLVFAYESTGRSGVVRHTIEFEPAEGGTLVTKEMTVVRGSKLFLLLKPIGEIVLSRRMAKDLERIAARLESAELP